jgi:uncharacterized protein YkwD
MRLGEAGRRPWLHCAVFSIGAAAAGCVAARLLEPRQPVARHGPERTAMPYDEPQAADKRAIFERINRDREAHGVPPVHYEPRAALVGDRFCLDAATTGVSGHWDLQGRAPYLRWGLAGGVDFHAQNAAAFSMSGGRFTRPLRDLMLEAHAAMMAEVPPEDGHRRTILDPSFTHVGIGLAEVEGEARLTEEFTRVAFEWMETPAAPLRAGQRASFAGRPIKGWSVGLVEVRFEPPPKPLTLLELGRRRSYGYPAVVRTLLPAVPVPRGYLPATRGDFYVGSNGSFSLTFGLDAGPGHYFVLCYLRKDRESTGMMGPATAAMITALP